MNVLTATIRFTSRLALSIACAAAMATAVGGTVSVWSALEGMREALAMADAAPHSGAERRSCTLDAPCITVLGLTGIQAVRAYRVAAASQEVYFAGR